MWSPEGRKQNAEELRKIADKVLRYRQLCDRFVEHSRLEPRLGAGEGTALRDPESNVAAASCLNRVRRA